MFKKFISTRFILVFSVVLIVLGFALYPQAAYNSFERVKTYYSGDAISYNGRLLIASTNIKGVEIFEVKNNRINLIKNFSSFDAIYSGSSDFNDVIFKVETGRLYLYLSDGRYIYKYDLADINNPLLLRQVMDNSYDWFQSLGRCGDNLITKGTKGLKIWNNDFNVIYSNDTINNSEPKNLQLEAACKYTFNINGDKVEVFNRFENYNFPSINIKANENHYRKILFDNNNSSFYLVDDWSLKQYNYEGKVLKNFTHISSSGYDVVASADQRYVYFSDGIGVVKSDKSNLKPVKWAYTTDLGGKNGWAMRIFAIKNNDGEKVIVFNNSNILVLNENLEKVDSHVSTEPDNSPIGLAFISADKTIASIGQWVNISGRGYIPHEDIKISLGDNYFYPKADDYGKFTYRLQIPSIKSGLHDLTAFGLSSSRTYSIGFKVIN